VLKGQEKFGSHPWELFNASWRHPPHASRHHLVILSRVSQASLSTLLKNHDAPKKLFLPHSTNSTTMNIFRLVADMMHLASIIILMLKMYSSQSVVGISLKTQVLYLAVFCTRYADLFTHWVSLYNTLMKVVFITSSAVIVYMMLVSYKQTYSKQVDTFKVELIVFPCVVLALLWHIKFTLLEILWAFSIFLEAVAILPQLYILQNTGECETITTHYLFALGAYRALYLVNWIYRYNEDGHVDYINWVAGTVQTALYLDFFYVYFTRVLQGQKFKLPV
jgi:ER lumen protein retaining receptor